MYPNKYSCILHKINIHRIIIRNNFPTLGYLSVVVIPMAAGRIESFCICLKARGIPSSVIAATGRRQPMIPRTVLEAFPMINIIVI